jgi:2-C-methyl-D-erythritol 4-phosphate cytidylyltransferase
MNIAVILSAGSGVRFNSTVPKQFLLLNGKPVIHYSLERFQKSDSVDSILVVSSPDNMDKTKELCSGFSKVMDVIAGGKRRQDSVWNGLEWINKNAKGCRLVLIHDAARPLFSSALMNELIAAAGEHGAAIPVIPTNDTIKEKEVDVIKRTLERDSLVRVQTPQVFDLGKIHAAYSKFPKEQTATDDAFVAEFFGIKVYTVAGEAGNIKITDPVDLKIAELLLKEVVR